jgi:hypothetical protein
MGKVDEVDESERDMIWLWRIKVEDYKVDERANESERCERV